MLHSRAEICFALLVVAALLAAACGSDEKSSSDAAKQAERPKLGGSSSVEAKLSIELAGITGTGPGGGSLTCVTSDPATCSGELTCPAEANGDDAWMHEACTYLGTARDDLFQELPQGQVCTMEFGGDQTGTISGTVAGEDVQVELSRTNGCEIARWALHEQLWGSDPDAASGGGATPPAGAPPTDGPPAGDPPTADLPAPNVSTAEAEVCDLADPDSAACQGAIDAPEGAIEVG